jgi:inorganic pyrophosphatase/exopolyphosphatase
VIVCFVDIGGIVDHHCLEVVVCFGDIGGIVDHHCLEVVPTTTPKFLHRIHVW